MSVGQLVAAGWRPPSSQPQPQMAPSLLDAALPFLPYGAADRRPLAAATTGRCAASSLHVGALKYCRIYKPYHRI
uniref:Uncharacterized protein n=1 Tax=Oryza glumipatula TaxID=40148 RepID=A0A0E0A952_9ORYZ